MNSYSLFIHHMNSFIPANTHRTNHTNGTLGLPLGIVLGRHHPTLLRLKTSYKLCTTSYALRAYKLCTTSYASRACTPSPHGAIVGGCGLPFVPRVTHCEPKSTTSSSHDFAIGNDQPSTSPLPLYSHSPGHVIST